MKLPNPIRWWRKLPQKTRVKLIAAVLLLLLGTEAIVFAPWAYEMAFLIDLSATGFFDVFVLGSLLLVYSHVVAFFRALWTRVTPLGSRLIHLDATETWQRFEDLCFSCYALSRKIPQRLTRGLSFGTCAMVALTFVAKIVVHSRM